MKRSKRGLSKKWMPKGSIRKVNELGKRVWFFGELQFETLRDLIFRVRATDKKDKEVV